MPAARFGENRKIQTAYVVFTSDRRWTFWRWFLDPGFAHCWLMLPAAYPAPGLMSTAFTMKIEMLLWGLDTEVWFAPPDVVVAAFAKLPTVSAIVAYTFETPPPISRPLLGLRGLITCVGIVKATLGIENHRILTPKALFVYLVRHRGTIIHI